MWGGDDPDERKPMLWPDINYENEVANISNTPRPVDPVGFDETLFQYYKKAIQLRKQEVALRIGTFKFVLTDDEKDIMIYERNFKTHNVLIAINNSDKQQQVELQAKNAKWKNLWDGSSEVSENNLLSLSLEPKSCQLFKRN